MHQLLTTFKVIPRVLAMIWSCSPLRFLLMVALLVFNGAIPAAIVWMTKFIIDTAVVALSDGVAAWGVINRAIIGIFCLWTLHSIAQAVASVQQTILVEKTTTAACAALLKKSASFQLARFDNADFHDALFRASEEIFRFQSVVSSSIQLIRSLSGLAALLGLLIMLHPLTPLILIVLCIPRIFLEGWMARRRYSLETKYTWNFRLVGYLSDLLTSRDYATEVRTFGFAPHLIQRFQLLRDDHLKALQNVLRKILMADMSVNQISFLGLAVIWAYAIWAVMGRQITIGSLAMVFQAAQQAQNQLNAVVQSAGQMYQNSLFVARYFWLIDLEGCNERRGVSGSGMNQKIVLQEPPSLELKDVTFRYLGDDKDVLQRVSFVILPNTRVAIVGTNGAGKSTLVKIVLGLYRPTSGGVFVNGEDILSFDLGGYRREVGVCFQDFCRYDLSFRENIAFGDVELMNSDERILDAAEIFGMKETIMRSPHGLDTPLGRLFEGATELSGGQWQRLALARAFVSDAPFLILDEPAAWLDAQAEEVLYEAILQESKDRTTIFISHRLSTVRMADLVVVLDGGVVAEIGDHNELIARKGRYAMMFTKQAERFL